MKISIYGRMHEFQLSERQTSFLLHYLKKEVINLRQFIQYVEQSWVPTVISEVWRKRNPDFEFDMFCITLNERLSLYLKRSRGMSNDWTEHPDNLKAPRFTENITDRLRKPQQWREHHDFWTSFWQKRNGRMVLGTNGIGIKTLPQLDPHLRRNDREWLMTASGEKPFEGLI